MDGRMVHDHHGLLRDGLTKRIKTGDADTGMDGGGQHKRVHLVGAIPKPSPIDHVMAGSAMTLLGSCPASGSVGSSAQPAAAQ
jgi:hypothetical protein